MRFYVFASGSKGNCTVIRYKSTCLMIDCGITQRSLKENLSKYGMSVEDITACVFTHSHSDHIKGVKGLRGIPLYAPFEIRERPDERDVVPYEEFRIGDLRILPVKLSHDAPETVGYIVTGDERLVMITDTGYVSERNFRLIQNAEYYIFEANHDVEMLMRTNRPAVLKARIISDYGHMNNEDTGVILSGVIGSNTREIVLAHLSEEANDPKLALDTVRDIITGNGISLMNIKLRAASQWESMEGGNL